MGEVTVARPLLLEGQGTGSGVSSAQTVWYASEWRDGRLLWYCAHESESESDALEAIRVAGLGDVAGEIAIVRRPPACARAAGARVDGVARVA